MKTKRRRRRVGVTRGPALRSDGCRPARRTPPPIAQPIEMLRLALVYLEAALRMLDEQNPPKH
jgi:hypothetical protein